MTAARRLLAVAAAAAALAGARAQAAVDMAPYFAAHATVWYDGAAGSIDTGAPTKWRDLSTLNPGIDGTLERGASFDANGDLVLSEAGEALAVDVETGSDPDGLTSFSCEVWFNPANFDDITDNGGSLFTSYGGTYLMYTPAGKISTYMYGTLPDTLRVGTADVYLNHWNHAAMTYDGAELKIYVNGELDATFPTTGAVDSFRGTSSVTSINIGPYTTNPAHRTWVGRVREARFYAGHVMSEEDMANSYAYSVERLCAGAPETPELDAGASEITAAGDLNVVVRTDARRYASAPQFRFVGATAPAECSSTGGVGAGDATNDDGVWLHEGEGDCGVKHTFHRPLPRTLAACGFAGPEEDADRDTYYYEATVEVETEEAAGEVFGQTVTRTDQTAMRVRVEFPRDAQVEAGGEAYGPAIDLALVSTQLANAATREFVFQLATSVQWPYYLVESGSVAPTASGGAFEDAAPVVTASSGGTCNGVGEGEDEACTQLFEIKAKTGAAECSLDTRVRVDFEIRCREAFAGACDAPAPGTTHAEFDVVTGAQLCAQVVEVAQVTPTLVTSTAKGGAQATDFVLQTTLFGRVSVAAEGGVATSSVVLTDLLIDSDCTSCTEDERRPLSDASPLASTYAWDTTPGTTFADFEFQLNANSVPFDTGAGQASITLTATVAVTYVSASGQQVTETRRVQMQAGAGETVSARATANFGVGSTPGSAGGSSSTAGSTVLGVSTGTAMVAGVGLVAVVALAAGAAVVGRRRRAARASKQVVASSSTASLNAAAAAAPPASIALAVNDLGTVQAAYESSAA